MARIYRDLVVYILSYIFLNVTFNYKIIINILRIPFSQLDNIIFLILCMFIVYSNLCQGCIMQIELCTHYITCFRRLHAGL